MRVAIVIDGLGLGGAQRLLVPLARHAPAAGLDLRVLALRKVESTVVSDALAAEGVEVGHVPTRSRHQLADLHRVVRLARELRRIKADVVTTHLVTANILGPAAARLASVPLVETLHNVRAEGGGIRQRSQDAALRRADAVVAVGDEVARTYAEALAHRPITVVPNPVDAEVFVADGDAVAAVRRELLGESGGPLLVAVGRLWPQKGYPVLLDAVQQLVDRLPTVVLAIAGEGPLATDLLERVHAQGLQRNVRLLGARRDVPALLGAADLFVSSSHYEGLPLALLEAMAAGTPVVATAVGDVGKVLAGAGVTVPPGDATALATAIEALLADGPRRDHLATRGRQVVRDEYDPARWVERLRTLYEDVGVRVPVRVLGSVPGSAQ